MLIFSANSDMVRFFGERLASFRTYSSTLSFSWSQNWSFYLRVSRILSSHYSIWRSFQTGGCWPPRCSCCLRRFELLEVPWTMRPRTAYLAVGLRYWRLWACACWSAMLCA